MVAQRGVACSTWRRRAPGPVRTADERGAIQPASSTSTAPTRASCTAAPMAGPARPRAAACGSDCGGIHRQRRGLSAARRRCRCGYGVSARPSRPRASHSQASRISSKRCRLADRVAALEQAHQRARRRTRRCGGCCRARAPPRRPARGIRSARAAARTSARTSSTLRCSWPMWRGSIVGRRGALAEVVAEAGKAHRQAALQAARHVEHHHQVHAGVDLGVVVGALRHAPQAVDLGQQARQRAAVAQHVEHARRARLHQAARELLPDALGHQRVDLAVLDHLRASARASRRRPRSRRSARRSAPGAGCAPGLRRRPATRGAAPAPRRSRWPPNGSISAPVSSRAIALIVRSRRARSCSSVTSGAAWKAKPW